MAAIASFERELIRERTAGSVRATRDGLRTTRSGRTIGRPPRFTPEVVERIREDRASGAKWSVIARRFGILSGTCRNVKGPPLRENPSVEKGP